MGTEGEPPLRAAVTRAGASAVVTLTGELDLATASPLRTRLSQLVQAEPPPAVVVLDVAGLTFVDAAGIAVLLDAQRALAAGGGALRLRSPTRLVRRVVLVLELEHRLPLEA